MIILCADDYGLSEGVSRGIAELCRHRRLSATSAMVTFERWCKDAQRLQDVRETTAAGLHLNLTLGRPLVAHSGAGHLRADGTFLPIGQLSQRALLWSLSRGVMRQLLDEADLRRECHAQIEAFRQAMGAMPDFIDGHQHAHALPIVRDALIAAIAAFDWVRPPLVRVPSSTRVSSGARGWPGKPQDQWTKRAIIAELTRGARDAFHAAGLVTNDTFAGFSSFDLRTSYLDELQRAFEGAGRCHLIMCHPGHVDEELAQRGDTVVDRRAQEFDGIMAFEGLEERIWHPTRDAAGAIDWAGAMQS